MFSSPLDPVQLGLWAGVEGELQVKHVDVRDTAQHESGGSEEVNDGCVGPGHRLRDPLVGELPPTVQVKHLQISVFAHSDSNIRFLFTL